MELIIDNRQDKLEVNEDLMEKIKDIISECLDYEGYDDDYEVSLSFVDNKEIHQLNRDFRGVNRPTDVLSFPLLVEDEFDVDFGEESLGDIVISIEKVKEQANEYGHSFERELSYMLVHGFYHIMGYDHIEEEDKVKMRAKEEVVLSKLKQTR